MSRNLHYLFQAHSEHIGKLRDIKTSGLVNISDVSKVESRALLFVMLDSLLHEHRKKYATPFNNLAGKKALVHLVLIKHHWLPEQIESMTLPYLLLSVQDELNYTNSSEGMRNYMDIKDWESMTLSFEDILEEEWNPAFSGQYLKSQPKPTY